jgi:disulfide bond formation protein DsbB
VRSMEKNVGGMDRNARIVGGLILLAAAIFSPPITVLKVLLYALAAIGLGTGLVGFCPLNALFKVNTAGTKKS